MKPFLFFFLVAFIAQSSSCNTTDDDENVLSKDGPFKISELAGNWEATKAQFSVNTTSIDVVERGGTAQMAVQANGRFTISLNPVDRDAYSVSGEMFWEEWKQTSHFTIIWDDSPGERDTYSHTYDGTTLSFNGGTGTGEYDFNNDGTMEACSVHYIFIRP
ncbi:hypothetical protein [Algoriphagus sp.]|uniref:hypothetical protein n=1 Tax=Algoriphagus sp. TaxID=1872435 RepID=UPI0025CEDB47|nr:hypothetical protein [Algoriphagus sp.]